MHRTPALASLPQKYQAIMRITSIERQVKLADLLMSIWGIIPRIGNMDVTNKIILERYFDFLTDSCTDTKTINERSLWLLHYGEVVYDRLLSDYRKRFSKPAEVGDDNVMVSVIGDLCEAFLLYEQGEASLPPHGRKITSRFQSPLSEIKAVGGLLVPKPGNRDYDDLLRDITTLSAFLYFQVDNKLVGEEGQSFVITRKLVEIQYRMDQYCFQHGFKD